MAHRAGEAGLEALPDLVGLFAEAFAGYPVMRWILADAGDAYDERLRALLAFFCRPALAAGHPARVVEAAGRIVGAAVVVPPRVTPGPEDEGAVQDLRTAIGAPAVARLRRYDRACEASGGNPGRCHYLELLGVAASHRGHGLARRLLGAVEARGAAHPTSAGILLNTEVEANVRLYRHLGFEVVGEADCDELHTWRLFKRRGAPTL